MNYILDTNIPILMVKNSKFSTFFENTYSKDTSDTFSISFVSLGELDSTIQQNQWGAKRIKELSQILHKLIIIPLDNKDFIRNYGTIDAYSQGKLKNQPLPMGMSARNMGKNDLWIAATARSIQATLITTDKDFDHLHPSWIQVQWVDVQQFQ